MTLKEMLEALVQGKKIRRKKWDKGEYIYMKNNRFHDELHLFYIPDFSEYDAFEIYEEPKKKVKLYKFAMKKIFSTYWGNTDYYYKDETSFIHHLNPQVGDKYMKLENNFIEVDEDDV